MGWGSRNGGRDIATAIIARIGYRLFDQSDS